MVVDDNLDNRRLLRLMLEKAGYSVHTAESGPEAISLFQKQHIDVVLLDLQMPEMDGITTLKNLRQIEGNAQVIVITAYGSIERAVSAMKAGALDFLTRPIRREVLVALVEKGLDLGRIMAENKRLQNEVGNRYDFSQLIGRSRQMQQILTLAGEAAKRDVTILITGESGVGKEVLARAVHYNSNRRTGPFFALNCAAITETLMESELFGHERGAFTGADRRKSGLLEQAARGSLLLDEIGDMPMSAQAKLLRVIENHEMIPVGGTQPVKVEARIMAATNCDLRKRVQEKQFREDLFFRLNVMAIQIPPLRERRDDILPLAKHILGKLARETGKDLPGLSKDAVDFLMEATWEGNVRELANAIERAVIVSQGNLITAADFPSVAMPMERATGASATSNLDGMKLEEVERTLLLRALERSGNNLTRAARLLGMGRGALRYRLEKHGISPRESNGEG